MLFLLILGCNSDATNHAVYGDNCKIWLIYDSGLTPFLLCFNNSIYEDYRIKSDGRLEIRANDPWLEQAYRGGAWQIAHDSLYLNNIAIDKRSINKDTIFIRKNSFLIDVTAKFSVENCDCRNLSAIFKGGRIDSLKTLVNY